MNNMLQAIHGELIVVFDADHVPVREFLQNTVGLFPRRSETVPRARRRISSPTRTRSSAISKPSSRMPSENEMFYGIIQKGLDKWNGAFFCGSAAVHPPRGAASRRRLLRALPSPRIARPRSTCIRAAGAALYVDKPMISGLQPETFSSFIGQRSRWARGMFQIFLLKNPVFKRGLTLAQKICYLSNMTTGSSRFSACRSSSRRCCSSISICRFTSPTRRSSSPTPCSTCWRT